MRVIIENTSAEAGRWAANYVAAQINAKAKEMRLEIMCVKLIVQSHIFLLVSSGKLRLESTLEQRKLGSDGH